MAITVALRHRTRYVYERHVALGPQVIRLRPAPHTRTPIEQYRLRLEPKDHFVNWQQDAFGNWCARVVVPERTDHFEIDVELVARLDAINPFDFFLDESAEELPLAYDALTTEELAPYLPPREEVGPRMRALLDEVGTLEGPTVPALVGLANRLEQAIAYEVRMEPGVQTPEHTLERGAGSCRDSGWLLVELLRHQGLAARFVSGYLVQLAPDERPIDGPGGPEADFTDLHAWAEVYLPGAGWLGLDPTSGLAAAEGHIPLACTPTPPSAAPVTGALEPTQVSFEHENAVTRVAETPRVTKPYTDEAWAAIVDAGHHVDRILADGDVRLTMGGEPTFVAVDDPDGDEWNTEADGPTKRGRAEELLERLWDRFTPGAVLHCGQGKWYPGEELPRWQYSLLWRPDGPPLWSDRSLLASPLGGDDDGDAARRFAHALGAELDLGADHWIDAYEDPVYNVWREATLPVDVDVDSAELLSVDGRRDLLDALERGLDRPVGHVLPFDVDPATGRWRTSSWPLRRSHLFAAPGTSPLGYRLPLDTLPADPELEVDVRFPRDPFDSTTATAEPGSLVVTDRLVRTALAVEERAGSVRLFLPPLTDPERAADLLAAAERAAAATGVGIVIEGYPPPTASDVRRLSVTPDPGVIEVNVHPSSSWDELTSITEGLYDDVRHVGLTAESFDLDGSHTGTGGGNHLTLGAARPEDSPFLRRPHLLTSMITYWQHHPSLSYLFSGQFVGPTSQAPRVDEGRDDRLDELEIAFAELDRLDDPPPWAVDRSLRNLLTDLTGNTHRSEFCIDKLFSPEGSTGRLGLVELRGFEMPPHWRMSLVQALLVRSLVARFWDHPYRRPLVRWGSELHDRFLLPHDVAADLGEVVEDLRRWGFPIDPDWFQPFLEFRFPLIGAVRSGPVELDVRSAIEPWPVLGEEQTSQGTARYVDSSMERLQVRMTGATAGRHGVVVNGREVPLRATGTPGEYVAGIRYRAWHPPSALHPTIGVDTPLEFHLWDRWRGEAIAGCTYHVSHPGGRNYETFPVNAVEAESRRSNRFEAHRHIGQAEPGDTAADADEPTGWVAPSRTFELGATAPLDVTAAPTDEAVAATFDLRRR